LPLFFAVFVAIFRIPVFAVAVILKKAATTLLHTQLKLQS
jgi:hypothetical protein